MLLHGIAKLTHGIDFIKSVAGVFAYGVYVGEVLAPIAILIGFRTRIAAAVYAVNCLVLYKQLNLYQEFSNTVK